MRIRDSKRKRVGTTAHWHIYLCEVEKGLGDEDKAKMQEVFGRRKQVTTHDLGQYCHREKKRVPLLSCVKLFWVHVYIDQFHRLDLALCVT